MDDVLVPYARLAVKVCRAACAQIDSFRRLSTTRFSSVQRKIIRALTRNDIDRRCTSDSLPFCLTPARVRVLTRTDDMMHSGCFRLSVR